MGAEVDPTVPPPAAGGIAIARLRRCILQHLYAFFRRYPDLPTGLDELAAACGASPAELNWNIVYLEKCGYLELSRGYPAPPYAAISATISVRGIDLVEDPAALAARFAEDAPEGAPAARE